MSYRNRLKVRATAIADGGLGAITVGPPASVAYLGFISTDNGHSFKLLITEGTRFEICDSVYSHSGGTLSRGAMEDSTGGTRQAFTNKATVEVIVSGEQLTAMEADASGMRDQDVHDGDRTLVAGDSASVIPFSGDCLVTLDTASLLTKAVELQRWGATGRIRVVKGAGVGLRDPHSISTPEWETLTLSITAELASILIIPSRHQVNLYAGYKIGA